MSKTELERLRDDLGAAALDMAIAASDPASSSLVDWANAHGYAITAADLPAAAAFGGPLDDATLDGMAGGAAAHYSPWQVILIKTLRIPPGLG